MLRALVDQAAGKETQAVEGLLQVLAQAEPEGYVRLFLDEGRPMAALLQQGKVSEAVDRLIQDRLLPESARASTVCPSPLRRWGMPQSLEWSPHAPSIPRHVNTSCWWSTGVPL